jgi:hypothetical protein
MTYNAVKALLELLKHYRANRYYVEAPRTSSEGCRDKGLNGQGQKV